MSPEHVPVLSPPWVSPDLAADGAELLGRQELEGEHKAPVEGAVPIQGAIVDVSLLPLLWEPVQPPVGTLLSLCATPDTCGGTAVTSMPPKTRVGTLLSPVSPLRGHCCHPCATSDMCGDTAVTTVPPHRGHCCHPCVTPATHTSPEVTLMALMYGDTLG